MEENKIDHRHRYGIILDTETANTIVEEDGKLEMSFALPYDVSFGVIDTKANLYETFAFVNEDIFCDEFSLMQSAYYAKKIPDYIKDLAHGTRILANTYTIRKTLLDKIAEYGCEFIVAHNARFDYKACNNIQRWTTKSKYRYFFPKDIEIWDSLKMANSVIAKMPTYRKFCEENGYMTKHKTPRPQLTAEVLYRFITKDTTFVEEHKGLEDILIELEIFKYCRRQHKAMDYLLFEKK